MRFRVEFEAFFGQTLQNITLAGISSVHVAGVAIRQAIRSVAGEIGHSKKIRTARPADLAR
jgi:hypothetical protein